MATSQPDIDYWSLTSPQLATKVAQLANASPTAVSPATSAETRLLALEWQEALNLPKDSFEQQEARRAKLAALQRRSIEVLIHASQSH